MQKKPSNQTAEIEHREDFEPDVLELADVELSDLEFAEDDELKPAPSAGFLDDTDELDDWHDEMEEDEDYED